MVYYAVIDTNVLVSALLTRHEDASPLQVVKRLFRGDIIPLYDEEIVGEYAEVLRRPSFIFLKHWSRPCFRQSSPTEFLWSD